MAAVELQVFSALNGATAAGSRVYPLLRAEGSALPAIVYSRVGNAPVNSLNGSSGLDAVRIQVDTYATTYAQAKQVGDQVRVLMQAAPFKALLQTDLDAYEQDTKLFRFTQDFACWQK